jgi:putative FmdB family regulatory protein
LEISGENRCKEKGDIMPTYDYGCLDCSEGFSVIFTLKEMNEQPKVVCPHCGSDNVQKKMTVFVAKTNRKS